MLDIGRELAFRHAVAPQFVGHDRPRHILQSLHQTSEETSGRIGVATFLNRDVEHDAILIHGAPKIVLHTVDPDEHFVEVPLVPGPWPSAAQAVCKALAEFLASAPNGLIGHHNTAFSQKQLNISQAEAEHNGPARQHG